MVKSPRPGPDPEQPGEDARLPDDELITRLGAVLEQVDQPPAWAVELAAASYSLRSVDAELAALVADSDIHSPAVAVRAAAGTDLTGPRLLSFEHDDWAVELEVDRADDGTRTVRGQVVPAGEAELELQQPGRPVQRLDADRWGWFSASGVLPGPVRLVVRRAGAGPLTCDWVVID